MAMEDRPPPLSYSRHKDWRSIVRDGFTSPTSTTIGFAGLIRTARLRRLPVLAWRALVETMALRPMHASAIHTALRLMAASAVLGARIRQPPRDGEDLAEVGVGTGVVGLEAGGLAEDRNALGHGRQRPGAIAAFLEQVTIEDIMLADVRRR